MELLSIIDHFIIRPIFWHNENIILKDKEQRVFDRAERALLSNSSSNLKYCIENAKYYLNLSYSKNIKKISGRNPNSFKYSNGYDDHIRAIGHKFLIPSILVYNASFDYIRIFLFFLLFKRTEIIGFNKTTKERVIKEMQTLGLKRKSSWIFALNSLITKNKTSGLFNNRLKDFLSDECLFGNLKKENETLKKDHCANLIKHQQIPFFKPKFIGNVGGAKSFPNIDEFYLLDKGKATITVGLPEIDLDIDITQAFLIKYHNKTVTVFNYLLDKIKDIG